MIKTFATVLFVVMMAFTTASAHPPTGIELEYDTETQVLTVRILHSVKKVNNHFIDKIVVELNDNEIITQKFARQSSEPYQEVQYTIIDAKTGGSIAVTGFCNISGKKKVTLEVEQKE
jgi:desulfoferrodoxin (superoxide reductase-like protein)